MIYKITLCSFKNSVCNAMLCDSGLIQECMEYAIANHDQYENNPTIIFDAMSSIHLIIGSLRRDSFGIMTDNRLLIVLKNVIGSTSSLTIKGFALNILHSMVLFSEIEYLL